MKILIIGPSWIGDSIMSQTMYRVLIKNNPKTKIDVITSNQNQSLFFRMPEIHNILVFPYFKHGAFPLKKYYEFAKFLKNNKKYEQAIILPNSFKSGLIPFFANIPMRTGWRGEMRYGIINDIRILNQKNFPLMIQRYAALAFEKKTIKTACDLPKPLPWPHIYCGSQETQIISKKFNINKNNNNQKKTIGICPGSEFGVIKRWPIYHYANLTLQLIHQGYQTILLGSYKEKNLGQLINNQVPKNLQIYCNNLIGQTSLDEATLIINKCDAIISNDSGLMHIACALQKPVVALYGPTNPNFTPPLHNHVKIIQQQTNNYYDTNFIKTITRKIHYQEGYHPSLTNIQPKQILTALEMLL